MHYIFFHRLHPEDLKLSDMMASSAAVLSSNMGLYQLNMDTIRDIQIILGINMGRSLVVQSLDGDRNSVRYLCSNYVSSTYCSFPNKIILVINQALLSKNFNQILPLT
jgi:hypothetical protein